MDIIFRKFWEVFKDKCTEVELEKFEKLIEEDDLNLYQWISGRSVVPAEYEPLISQIREQIFLSKV